MLLCEVYSVNIDMFRTRELISTMLLCEVYSVNIDMFRSLDEVLTNNLSKMVAFINYQHQ